MDHGLLPTQNETMNTTNTYMAWIATYRTMANKTNAKWKWTTTYDNNLQMCQNK